nr:MAG TPA: hypothetical protein [Caudoviricetes sp.]
MRLASVRQTLETGFIILGIPEPRFDALRFKDRCYLPAAGIDDGVIALVPSVTVVVFLRTVIEQVHVAGRVSLRFSHFVHRIQSAFNRLDVQVKHMSKPGAHVSRRFGLAWLLPPLDAQHLDTGLACEHLLADATTFPRRTKLGLA